MQENTQQTTETKPDVELTQEQQLETARKVATMNQRALSDLVRLDIRNYLNMLTAPNVDGKMQLQIKQSIERAIVMCFDFGVDVVGATTLQSGKLAKQENAFAAHLVRLKENSMVLIADNMRKQELNAASNAAEENKNENT